MLYRTIGLMSGSSLDGLDIAFVELHENGGKWSYEILEADCYPYTDEWINRLQQAIHLNGYEYQLLHAEYGHYLGEQVNRFIDTHGLQYKVALIASHGHTTFHVPSRRMTAQLGDGSAIAAVTKLPVVSDLRALDVALGGQGAPIVPIGEKLLLGDYDFFLNLGGIANISVNADNYVAFDVCPANRVLNMLAGEIGQAYDKGGTIAAGGSINDALLASLNGLAYYSQPYPKSLANDFGTDVVFPIIKKAALPVPDALRTYCEHIAIQLHKSVEQLREQRPGSDRPLRLLATGGGALNTFLMTRVKEQLQLLNTEVIIPGEKLVNYKEALVMALIGVLRWREEYNVIPSVTGASRASVGGALWMGQEA
ncbi:anhydro-N-acetylmuramic acid kinase [Ostertagia ostertagi]